MILRCIKCNGPLMKPGDVKPDQVIGLVCGNNACDRFGLLSVVGKKDESKIITPNNTVVTTDEFPQDKPI